MKRAIAFGALLASPVVFAASAIDSTSLTAIQTTLTDTATAVLAPVLVVVALVLGMTKGLGLLKRLFGAV